MKTITIVIVSLVCLIGVAELAASRSKKGINEFGPVLSNHDELLHEMEEVAGTSRGKRSTHDMNNEEDVPEEAKQVQRARRSLEMKTDDVPESEDDIPKE